MKSKKPKQGGDRPGAGMKPSIANGAKVQIVIAPDADAIAKQLGDGNRSLGIDIALRAAAEITSTPPTPPTKEKLPSKVSASTGAGPRR